MGVGLSTTFDFVTVAIFLGIVALYIRYAKNEEQDISAYIWPSVGCALANYFGNKDFDTVAWILVGLTTLYVYRFIIRPSGVPQDIIE